MSATAILVVGVAICLFGFVALGMTALNLLTWTRGSRHAGVARWDGRVSVLIPARNEEANIEAAVRSVFASAHPVDELIVCDDQSTDRTPEILARLGEEFPRLTVIRGEGLPAGWVGKPHACHRLAQHAVASEGDLLVFLDADTTLTADGLERVVGLAQEKDAALVTAVPRQVMGSAAERLILPLLHLTYTSWFWLPLTWLSRDPRFLAANGQLVAMRREVYDAVGGFASVRDAVVDDMALCRRVKEQGHRVVFADGFEMAQCRMYTNTRGVWEGFSKNIYPGLDAKPHALLIVLALYTMAFIAPYAALAWAALAEHALLPFAAAAVAANLLLRALLAARYRHPISGIALHPLGVAGLLAIAVNSWRWHTRGGISWSGRTYTPGGGVASGANDSAAETHNTGRGGADRSGALPALEPRA